MESTDWYPYFASRNSEPSALISSRHPWRPGWLIPPRHFASHVTPRSTLIGLQAQRQRPLRLQSSVQKPGESTNRSEFCHLWGIDKLIFWSHYVLKQRIGRLLLCSICHIMVNCLRNADWWTVSLPSETWCELCFVNTGAYLGCQSHGA